MVNVNVLPLTRRRSTEVDLMPEINKNRQHKTRDKRLSLAFKHTRLVASIYTKTNNHLKFAIVYFIDIR